MTDGAFPSDEAPCGSMRLPHLRPDRTINPVHALVDMVRRTREHEAGSPLAVFPEESSRHNCCSTIQQAPDTLRTLGPLGDWKEARENFASSCAV